MKISKKNLTNYLNDLQIIYYYVDRSKKFFKEFDNIAFNLELSESDRLNYLQKMYLEFESEVLNNGKNK